MFKHLIVLALIFSLMYAAEGQGYKIDFVIDNLPDTTIMLGHFFGESTYLSDTAHSDNKGRFTFQGTEKLEMGMYFLVLDKTRLLDILVGEDQEFSIETKGPEYLQNMKIEGDLDNTISLEYRLFNGEQSKLADPFVTILRDSTSSDIDRKSAMESFSGIRSEVDIKINEIISEHPQTVIAKFLAANRPVKVPQIPESEGNDWAYLYHLNHFWDDFDLGDPTLLRLSEPIYDKKVDKYFDEIIPPHPDTVINAIERLSVVAKKNSETYRYFIWKLTIKYQQPEIMGLDNVFVHLYDRYFASGEMDFWANDQLKENIKEEVDKIRKSLVGKVAPNLIMLDADLQRKSLYEMKNEYTVIYFYDPDCGYCKKETPELKKFYDNTNYDVGVFTVSADTSMAKMKKYIEELSISDWTNVNGPRTHVGSYHKLYDAFTTPTLYLINDKKEIIAKKIQAIHVEGFLDSHEKSKAIKVAE